MHDPFLAFQEKFIADFERYHKLLAELDTYRGKQIDHDLETVNALLLDIQKTFESLYPMLAFIAKNSAICAKSINDYHLFKEDIQKAGAQIEVINAQS